ncbi:hypothetical protein AEM42_10995 [Betaproteobacteria bacterium UKL13-2]|nr:hypothetical protein AEM42_10995 [Betaproteobacteria bacterium UKL13-2]
MSSLLNGGNDHPGADDIQVLTKKVSSGLGLSAVELPCVGYMNAVTGAEKEAARVFYVAATRARQRLVMGVGGDGRFAKRLYH